MLYMIISIVTWAAIKSSELQTNSHNTNLIFAAINWKYFQWNQNQYVDIKHAYMCTWGLILYDFVIREHSIPPKI